MLALLTNASAWFPFSVALAALAVLARHRSTAHALSLAFGCVIGTMGTGHVVAVTIRAAQGTLEHGMTWTLYPIGILLAVPAWHLVASAWRGTPPRRLVLGNAAVAVALAVMGPAVVLAVFAVLNVVYVVVARPAIRTGIVALTVLTYAAMFVASFVTGTGDF